MSLHGHIGVSEPIVMKHLSGPLGIVRGWALEDKYHAPGESSSFHVSLDRNSIKGVSEMTINTNEWDVYAADHSDLANVLLEHFAPLERD